MPDDDQPLERLQDEFAQTRQELEESRDEVARLKGQLEKSQTSAFEERQTAWSERLRLLGLMESRGTVAGQARQEVEADRAQLRNEVTRFKSLITGQLDQMRRHKLRSERFVETAPVGIAYLDKRLYYRWANPAFAGLMGRSPEEVIGHPLLEVFPQAQDRLVDRLQAVLATGKADPARKPVMIPITTQNAGGRATTNWDLLVLPMVGEKERIEGVLVAVEVTHRVAEERRQQEQIAALTRAGRTKGETLAAATGELRSGLASLSESAGSMGPAAEGLTEEQRRYIAKIRSAEGQLARIVDDLLELARIEAGSYELHYEEADVSALVRVNLERLAEEVARAKVHPEIRLSDEPLIVKADRRRLDRVLQALLGNAIRSTMPGGRMTVAVTAGDQEATVTIVDSGKGIDAKELGKVFDQFSQLNLNEPEEFERAAAGLAISKTLIELHGGIISAMSEQGKGSTFSFKLPLAKQEVKSESSMGLRVSMLETAKAERASEDAPGEGRARHEKR